MADCVMETWPEAKAKADRRGLRRRGRGRSARAYHPAPEVYVVPEGMVDLALRELDARLVFDESDSPEARSAA